MYFLFQSSSIISFFGGSLICLIIRMMTMVDEKNEKIKDNIRKKINEYLDRAEKLKEHLAKPQKKKAVSAANSGKYL